MRVVERLRTLGDTAAIVCEPLRLGVQRLRGRPTVGRYHLRGSGLAIHLRHDVLEDIATLIQTFRRDHYVLPTEAEGVLRRLGRPPQVMDLGANIGMFGAWFLSNHPQARVIAYEADPDNAHIHAMTSEANQSRTRWDVVAAAAGTHDGEVRFVSGHATNSRLAEEGDAEAMTVPQHDVLARAGGVDLLKVDIEGAEWALLDDDRFVNIPARVVALEYHLARCPEPDPRALSRRRLEEAGFRVTDGELEATPGHGMVWGWRTA
jgi:FkbM family methyltransferase